MLKTYLIDDEPESIQYISSLIEQADPDINISGKFTDPTEGLLAIQKEKPDVLLLDIEMPKMTGLELLRQVGNIEFEVIFITAYNQYALNAIRLSALAYLLKPVDPDELEEALQKAKHSIHQKEAARQYEILDDLMKKNPEIRRSQESNIALPVSDGLRYVPMSNILRVVADHQYCDFYLSDGSKMKVSRNIGSYEESLDGYGFMRVHRKHIVNLCKVVKYIRHQGGYVELENGLKAEVSNPNKLELLRRLQEL